MILFWAVIGIAIVVSLLILLATVMIYIDGDPAVLDAEALDEEENR